MTKAEKSHYAKLVDMGCIVCQLQGYGHSACEIHHTRHGAGMGQKSHYLQAIPLCPPHHRTGPYGVAFHAGAAGFENLYGTEVDLLAATTARLKGKIL